MSGVPGMGRLTRAFEGATRSIRAFNDAYSLSESREVARHPDLAELNVALDGWYGEGAGEVDGQP